MKPELLFLAHRIPYPPDKGDKIRSYHLLRALAVEHTVHLGTFVDNEDDWQHVDAVRGLCGGEVCVRPLHPRAARLRSARGLLTGEPLTLAYYRDTTLARWVRALSTRRPLAGVFAFSSSMGQYAEMATIGNSASRVLDFCDVDSDKWRQYSATNGFPIKLVYEREARKLASIEARYVKRFDRSLVISPVEAQILRASTDESDAARIEVIPNGVDTDYFDPARRYANPFDPGVKPIVFTGAMDYHANVDGVNWFAREVLPAVRAHDPTAVFFVVGSNPVPDVLALRTCPGVRVVGRVPDVRPYLAHAATVVAPLRLARGVQNKVLEALAMARPVVATPNAVQGMPAAEASGAYIRADAAGLAEAMIESLLEHGAAARGRDFVTERFSWQRPLERVCEMFQSTRSAQNEEGASKPVSA